MWRSLALRGEAAATTSTSTSTSKKLLLLLLQQHQQAFRFFSEDSNSKELSSSSSENEQDYEASKLIESETLDRVCSLLQSPDVIDETAFNSLDIPVHQDFLLSALRSPLATGDNLFKFYTWASKKPGFEHTAPVLAQLVSGLADNGCVRRKNVYALWDLVKDVGVANVDVLNGIIGVLGKMGKGKAALEVFDKFGELGCVPDSETFYLTIEGLCARKFFDWACLVSDKMVDARRLPGTAEKVGKVISWLCKGKKGESAYSVYVLAKELELVPPQSSVNFLIGCLCREDGTVGLAPEILDDFQGKSREYAIKSFSSVISGLCRVKDVEGAKKLLLKMISGGPRPGNAVFNSVISAYSKAGDMGEATALMKLMESRGLRPDVYTYTVVISGYANGGQMEEACKILSEAKKKHTKLSPVTYHTLIRGYCKLEEFDKAMKLFGEMKHFGVQPNVDEYNKLIQSLCLKALDWESAEKLLEKMKKDGLYLNGITRGLIRAVKELEQEESQSAKSSLEA